MSSIKTTLLRERFELFPRNKSQGEAPSITAVSNRIVVGLGDPESSIYEEFIVRTQTMHSCVRLAARIMQAYKSRGPILNRTPAFNWDEVWDQITSDYDYVYNTERWAAVYCQGKEVYKNASPHPFLDVIEKCDYEHDGIYDEAVYVAERAFLKKGNAIKINYTGNIALIVDLNGSHGRFGVILRGPDRTTTFSYTIESIDGYKINPVQSLSSAAAYLEGIQIAYRLGRDLEPALKQEGIRDHKIEVQAKRARERLWRLEEEISVLEHSYDVSYRPEPPDFFQIAREAESLLKPRGKPITEEDFF